VLPGFKIGSALVEYSGLAGDPDYDAKIELKRALAAQDGVALIEVYPADLADTTELVARLSAAVGSSSAA
jgi:hypothetical protein